MKITIAAAALNDLESIKAYYLDQGVPQIGNDFIVAIFNYMQSLAKHPRIGRIVPEFSQDHIREIIHPPNRIVYLLENTSIKVIRVWRSERPLSLPKEPT